MYVQKKPSSMIQQISEQDLKKGIIKNFKNYYGKQVDGEDEEVPKEEQTKKDFSIYERFVKSNGKKGGEILNIIFKQLSELPEEKEIEEEYIPYV